MQSLALITKEFVIPPSELIFHGDLNFYQTTHLPCEWFNQDTKYNRSLFEIEKWESYMSIDHYLSDYFHREGKIIYFYKYTFCAYSYFNIGNSIEDKNNGYCCAATDRRP